MVKVMIRISVFIVFILGFNGFVGAQVNWEGRAYNPDSLVYTGLRYLKNGDVKRSIDLSHAVLSKYPDYVDFTYILASSLLKSDQPERAEGYFRQVLLQTPDYTDAFFGLLSSLNKQAKFQSITLLVESMPDSLVRTPAFRELAVIIDAHEKAHNDSVRREKVDELRAQARYVEAIVLLDSLIVNAGAHSNDEQIRADMLIQSKQFQLAEVSVDSLLKRRINMEKNLRHKAFLVESRKDYRLASTVMDSLVAIDFANQSYKKQRAFYQDNIDYKYYAQLEQNIITYDRPQQTFLMTTMALGYKVKPSWTLIGQSSWADLRNGDGFQYQLDSWMTHNSTLYSYASAAYSNAAAFTRWRLAYTLYKEFPGWLVDAGARYMVPQIGDGNFTGVLSVGKFISNNLFYLRSFWTYDTQRLEKAFSLAWRHYYNESKPETYFTIIGNIGTSPDDRDRYQFYNNPSVFKSYSLTMGLQHRVNKYVLATNGSWGVYKINDSDYLNQYNLSLSIKRYF